MAYYVNVELTVGPAETVDALEGFVADVLKDVYNGDAYSILTFEVTETIAVRADDGSVPRLWTGHVRAQIHRV